MAKKHLLSKKPLIWFHYLLLIGIIILAYFESKWLGLMNLTKTNQTLGWILLILLYYINISIGDQLIHYVLRVD